jgi:predicted DNA-binding transcriptional regulator AlpA
MSRRTSRSNTAKRSNYSANRVNYSATKRPRRIVRLPGVMAKTGWAKSTVWANVAAGILPPPAHLGRAAIWDEDEIDAIVNAAFDKRDQAVAG